MGKAPKTNLRLTPAIRAAIVVGLLLVVAWFISPFNLAVWGVNYDIQNHGKGADSIEGSVILGTIQKANQSITDDSWLALYELAASELNASMTREQFATQWQQIAESVNGIEQIEVLEIVEAQMEEEHIVGSAYVYPWVPSEVLRPEVMLSSPVSGRIAFVLCKSLTDNGTMVTWLSMVLKLEETGWRLVQLFLKPAEVAGHDGEWFWQKSKEFESSGQLRNAFFYGQIAIVLLTPSSAISSTKARDIEYELVKPHRLNLPLDGQRPSEQWKIDDDLTVTVDYVSPVTSGAIVWLEIRFDTSLSEVQSDAASAERKKVYQYVIETFPEYQDGFAGIYVGSVNEGGAGFRDAFPFDESNPQPAPNWEN